MTFQESIKTCFAKYATFEGKASRSEYWWFVLFTMLAGMATSIISGTLGSVFYLATLLPTLAAASRRLHDTGRSGWWQLVVLIPVLGVIMIIVFLAQKGQSED